MLREYLKMKKNEIRLKSTFYDMLTDLVKNYEEINKDFIQELAEFIQHSEET